MTSDAATPAAPPVWRLALAEGIGTFVMVFAGTGAIVIEGLSGGAVTHLGIALTFGLVVMAMIYSLGELSGAHMNPAVTLGFAVSGRFAWARVVPYWVAQCAGACAASLALRLLFVEHATWGATVPAGSPGQSFGLELILTAVLMFVILRVSTGSKETGWFAGIAVGGTVGLEALFAGPISGASMNPARSLGPAVVGGPTEHLWIYFVATAAGALVGVVAAKLLEQPDGA